MLAGWWQEFSHLPGVRVGLAEIMWVLPQVAAAQLCGQVEPLTQAPGLRHKVCGFSQRGELPGGGSRQLEARPGPRHWDWGVESF